MSRKHKERQSEEERFDRFYRRAFLSGLGAAGMAGLAGCGGDGDGDTETQTTETEMDDTDTEMDDTETEMDDTATEADERVWSDQIWHNYNQGWRLPLPADVQWNFFAENSFDAFFIWDDFRNDWAVNGPQLILMERINHQPGLVEFEYQSDPSFRWWDGTEHTLDDFIWNWQWQEGEWAQGPDYMKDIVVRRERVDDTTMRYYLSDTYNAQFAHYNTLGFGGHFDTQLNQEQYGSWYQDLSDASTEDERTSIMDELSNTTWDDPQKASFIHPFMARDATDEYYQFELRKKEADWMDQPEGAWVKRFNFDTFRWHVYEEQVRHRQAFIQGKAGRISGTDAFEIQEGENLDFETEFQEEFPLGGSGPSAYLMNGTVHPFNNVHFRRAWAYLLDRETHTIQRGVTLQNFLPFYGKREARVYGDFSDEFLDSLNNYGPGESMVDAAEAEMEAGGFERNSDGRWLYQEGDQEGDPIEETAGISQWANPDWMRNNENFVNALDDFGISFSVEIDDTVWGRMSEGEYRIDQAYFGGRGPYPSSVHERTFAIDNGHGGRGFQQFPPVWEGPEIGNADAPGERTKERTYEVKTMINQMPVTADQEQWQDMNKQLTWVFNQGVPIVPIGYEINALMWNTEDWSWPLPRDEEYMMDEERGPETGYTLMPGWSTYTGWPRANDALERFEGEWYTRDN